MNRNKLIALLLLAAMALSALVACDGGEDPAATSAATAAATQAATEAATEAAPANATLTATLLDQEGVVYGDVSVTFMGEDEYGDPVVPVATATSDSQGKLTVSLPLGTYAVEYGTLPDGCLATTVTVTVEGDGEITLDVLNNTPNGTAERPFVISGETLDTAVPAGGTCHYRLLGAGGRTLTVNDPNAEVTYGGNTYTADENGQVKVLFVTEHANEMTTFSITNKGSDDMALTLSVVSPLGSLQNPIPVALGEAVTASVPKEGIVYYVLTAETDGTLTVASADVINNIAINNHTTSNVSAFSEGGESVSLGGIKAGDRLVLAVSTLGGDTNAEFQSVTFTVTLAAE